jgi:hypothetical protein
VAQRSRVVIVVPGRLTREVNDTMGRPYQVPYPVPRTFDALREVYEELKLPREVPDSAGAQVATGMFYRQGSLAGRQLSSFLHCGEAITGPIADTYRIYLNIWSSLVPEGRSDAVLRTVVLAGAVNVSEGSRQPLPCESRGRLEARIHQLLLLKLAAGKPAPDAGPTDR